MKSHSIIPARAVLTVLCGAALAAGVLGTSARADEWNQMTILTVKQPIQVTNTVLQPGQYVLKLLNSQSNRDVVEIFDHDQRHIINTIIAVPTMRLHPTGRTVFTFWETPPGTDRALRDWYYPGFEYGHEFPYPKHLQQVAMVTPAPAPAPPPAAPAPAPQPEAQAPAPAPEQPEVAQNTAPPAPETPAQTQPEQPAMPKTGSPYPAIGMLGGLLLFAGGLLRLRRHA